MRILISAGWLLVLSVCVSCTSKSLKSNRYLASEDTSNVSIVEYAQALLDLYEKDQKRPYRVTRFPVQSDEDASPGGFEKEFVQEVSSNKILEDSWSLFIGIAGAVDESTKNLSLQKMKKELHAAFSLEERMKLLSICFSGPKAVGDKVYMASPMALNLCEYSQILYTQEELTEAIVTFPSKPQGVHYEGSYGYHVYQDKNLETKVQLIVTAANRDKKNFYTLFHSLLTTVKVNFQRNKDSLADTDKVEPFDLLSTATTGLIMSKGMGKDPETGATLNKIQISKLSQKAFARLFLMLRPEDDYVNSNPSISVIRAENTLTAFCANGIFDSKSTQIENNETTWRRSSLGTELVEAWNPIHSFDQVKSSAAGVINFTCNTNKYRFTLRSLPGEKIPIPDPIDFKNQNEVQALITISLASEIDRSAIDQAKTLVSALGGWEIERDIEEVDTKSYFTKEFRNVDAYIPVMHAMDVNYFNIGTGQSYALKLKKTVTDLTGRSKDLKLTILFPNGSSKMSSLVMNPDDLAEILDQRYQSKPTPLFLLNNSCASEKTLFAWTLVFRKALNLRKARTPSLSITTVTDFPHVIGSKRYFSTSSLAQIFSHAEYPLKSLEMLTKGHSVNEVLAYLRTPSSEGFLGKITGLFSGASVDERNKGTGFEPEYVLDHPEFLSIGGFEVHFSGRGIKGVNQY